MDLETALLDQEAEAFIQDLGIPPCPTVITRVVRETRAEDPDFNRIAALISTDVTLSAAMLATVNSAYYGLRTKAESVHRALALLGLQPCTQLVTRLMLRQVFPVSNSPAMRRFWKVAAHASLLAGLVARATRSVDPDLASTFALFRDAGIPVLIARFPQYASLVTPEKMNGGTALLQAEDALCRINHVRVAFRLAGMWNLSDEMCLAIYHHHDYAVKPDRRTGSPELSLRLVAVGLVADGVAAKISSTPSLEWESSLDFALEQLSMDSDDFNDLVETARSSTYSGA